MVTSKDNSAELLKILEKKEEKHMPNWITNRVTLHGAYQKEINEVIDFLRSRDSEVDFNNIIPMPIELRNTEAGSRADDAWAYYHARELGNFAKIDKMLRYAWVKREGIKTRGELLDHLLGEMPDIYQYGKELHRLDALYGCHDWYEWSLEYWGVKWNACDARREGNILIYETPWDGVPYLMLMVSEKFPEVTMDYEFADENFGYNTARYTFVGGEVVAEYEPTDNTIESRQLSKSILGWEPGEEFDDETDEVA